MRNKPEQSHLRRETRRLSPEKRLSQNFLVDEEILAQIAAAAQTGDSSMPIVEIGAGGGFLTAHLLKLGHAVVSVEIDERLIPVLQDKFGVDPRFHLIHQDIRRVDIQGLFREYGDASGKGIIVGNVPYHLTGPILFQIMGEMNQPDYPLRRALEKVVLMVQYEVGERLTASPGESAYSLLSVQTQHWFQTEQVVTVPRTAFEPAPKVDSMVVQLLPREQPAIEIKDYDFYARFLKYIFSNRRKTIFKSMKMGNFGQPAALEAVLDQLGIAPRQRPEELSAQQLGAIANAIA